MKAVIQDRYGPPDILRVGEVPRPVPLAGQVLVRVMAATVTRGDAMRVRMDTYRFTKLYIGIRRPRQTGFGTEFAGIVEEVGPDVTEFATGDEVFGIRSGAAAEYAVVRATGVIAPMPRGLSFEEAAALPEGALLALSCLEGGLPVDGKDVLVYGAGGSVGTAAVQLLAHHLGATVTAVCDTEAVDVVRSLGAREVIDRTCEDFARNGRTYDLVFDAVGKLSFAHARRSIRPGGRYITMDLGRLLHVPFLSLVTRVAGSRRASLGVGRYRRQDLLLVKELVEAGTYRPVIDRRYDLDEVVDATRYVATGKKTGNVILRIGRQTP